MTVSSPTAAPAGTPLPVAEGLNLKPLMFETFVCTLAMMSFVALVGPIARVLGLAAWQAGMAVTVGGVAWVLLARRWGAASDHFGRRRVMLQGLGGFVLSYAALCVFIAVALRQAPPVWLAFTGMVVLRGIAGGFYAAVPATGAALIADHVPPQQRAGALAMLGAASGLGMVAGPGLVGLLAAYRLELPLFITAALPLVALLVLWRWLPRVAPQGRARPAMLKIGDPRLRPALRVAFVAMFSVMVAQVVVGFFALDRLQLDAPAAARVAGIALTVVGVALILAQLLVRRLGWPPASLIRAGCLLSALGFGSILFASGQWALWLGYFVAAAGMGWVFPAVTALAANAVQADEQGATAGTVAAAQGLGMILGPLAGTLVYALDPGAPYALVAIMLAVIGGWPGRAATVPQADLR